MGLRRVVWAVLLLVLGWGSVGRERVKASEENSLTILYTNDTRGYLQTCGCSHSGLGGLERRATLIQQVRAEQPHVLLLGSGNQAEEPERAEVILEAMAAMGYDALGVGPLDLAVRDRFFPTVQARGLTVVASPPRPASVPAGVQKVLVKEVGGRRVAILALPPSQTTDHRPQTTNHQSPVTSHQSPPWSRPRRRRIWSSS